MFDVSVEWPPPISLSSRSSLVHSVTVNAETPWIQLLAWVSHAQAYNVAVVVAIKGVGRFTELAAAESRERFIIGTLSSLTWACACATLVPMALA